MGSKREGNRKKKKRKEEPVFLPESDENFAFIAGYTSGGFPFGITWEEWEQIEDRDKLESSGFESGDAFLDLPYEKEERKIACEEFLNVEFSDDDLPFK